MGDLRGVSGSAAVDPLPHGKQDPTGMAGKTVVRGGAVEFELDRLAVAGDWGDYVRGAAAGLAGQGHALAGADLLISSRVPLGSGLSSSAALSVAAALALSRAAGGPSAESRGESRRSEVRAYSAQPRAVNRPRALSEGECRLRQRVGTSTCVLGDVR